MLGKTTNINNYHLESITELELLTFNKTPLKPIADTCVGQRFLQYIPFETITDKPVGVIGLGQIGSLTAISLVKYNPSVLDLVDFNPSQITKFIDHLIGQGYSIVPVKEGDYSEEIDIRGFETYYPPADIIERYTTTRPVEVLIEAEKLHKGIHVVDLPIERNLDKNEIIVAQSKFDLEINRINIRAHDSFKIDIDSSTNFEKLSLLESKGYKVENLDDRDAHFLVHHPITIRGLKLDITDLNKLKEFLVGGYYSIIDATSSAGLFGYNKELDVSIFQYNECVKHALGKSNLFSFVKVGTQGCGGMDPDHIPYSHNERGTELLLQKQASAFSTQQMLADSAKHGSNPRLGYIRPETAVGPLGKEVAYGVVKKREIKKNKEKNCLESYWRAMQVAIPYIYDIKKSKGRILHPEDEGLEDYGEFKNTYIDSGENGLFGSGDYEAISYANSNISQMGYVHPAEVAEIATKILLGYPSRYNILSGGNPIPPSYYSGVQRGYLLAQFRELETDETIPFLGNLGSHRLWSIAAEAFIIKKALISIGKLPTYRELLGLSLEETCDLMESWAHNPQNKILVGKIITTKAKIFTTKGVITSEEGISELSELLDSCKSSKEKERLCMSNCVNGWINTTSSTYKVIIPRSETKILRTGPYALLNIRLPEFLKRKLIDLDEEISPGKLVALTFTYEDLGYRVT